MGTDRKGDLGGKFMEKKKIERINELARKSKTQEGLTLEEKTEQKILRKEYISNFKSNLKQTLESIKYV